MADDIVDSNPATEPVATPESASESVDSQEVVDSVEAESDSPITAKDEKAEAAADKTGAEKVEGDKFELKVDGEVLILSKEEMIKFAQLGKAGQKRMAEAIEIKKLAESEREGMRSNWERLQKQLKENPESILEDENIGHNKVELAKRWLAEKIAEDEKSPEQKEIEKLKRERDEMLVEKENFRKDQEKITKQREQEAEDRETEIQLEIMEKDMLTAFAKYQLPNSPAMIDRMTGIMEFAHSKGVPATIDDVAKVVRDEIRKDIQELANMLPEEEFEELLGKAAIDKVKASTLKKIKNVPKVNVIEAAKAGNKSEPTKKAMTIDEFMKPDWAK